MGAATVVNSDIDLDELTGETIRGLSEQGTDYINQELQKAKDALAENTEDLVTTFENLTQEDVDIIMGSIDPVRVVAGGDDVLYYLLKRRRTG